MSLLVLSAQDVAAITASLKAEELEALMALVFHRLSSRSGYSSPHRTCITMPQHTALFMPSRVEEMGTAVKVVSVPSSVDDKRGLPASTMVLDEATGRVKAVVNASALTALRTAAGSVLATRLLLAKQQPTVLVTFGAGKQIEAHIDLHIRGFPSLTQCNIVNRTRNARLDSLLTALRRLHPSITFDGIPLDETTSVRNAVGRADIICTATSSTAPLFPSGWVPPGTHLNLVGSFKPNMMEVDSDLIRRAGSVVVDSRAACAIEAGELIVTGTTTEMVEIGTLLSNGDDGAFVPIAKLCDKVRRSGEVTIFKSVGVGLQDIAITSLVVSRAERTNAGMVVESYHE
ncbi:hypothetical protein ID866_10500 [Astraeus odoratus]|nr:hypothetical protein ID866_10500 [Astraeus odoratus]